IESLSHAQALRDASASAQDALDEAVSIVGRAVGALRAAPGSGLADAATAAAALQNELADAGRALRIQMEGFQEDPSRLAEAQERRARIGELKRKYGATIEAVLAFGAAARDRLAVLEGHEARAVTLEEAAASSWKEVQVAAEVLRAARHDAAVR